MSKKAITSVNRYFNLLQPGYDDGLDLDIQGGHYNYKTHVKAKHTVRMSKMVHKLKQEKSISHEVEDPSIEYEGGGGQGITKSQKDAGNKVKNLFHQSDIMGTQHLQKVGEEMQKHGSTEKTGFMEKEADFVKNLKSVQNYHIETCILLMRISMVVQLGQWFFSVFCIFKFGCGLGNCLNRVACWMYYIKFLHTMYLISAYNTNIKERQANHPIGTINTFIVIILYYACLYKFLDQLSPADPLSLIHYSGVFPVLDFLLMVISFIFIAKVKAKSQELINNRRFKEYNTEAEIALADILYLPQEFESDDNEEEF